MIAKWSAHTVKNLLILKGREKENLANRHSNRWYALPLKLGQPVDWLLNATPTSRESKASTSIPFNGSQDADSGNSAV